MKWIKRFFQFFKLDYEKLHASKTEGLFWLDIIMLSLVAFNLGWVMFDMAFGYEIFRSLLQAVSPAFDALYATAVHPNFLLYDLIFVTLFLLELTLRWAVAVYRNTYEKWFYYPFIHWYDVLGCIPLSSFRALRLLRVFSLTYRLQQRGIIDVKSSFFYKRLNRYMNIFTEEVSDRVVINVLKGVQDELRTGSPVAERVIREVLLPRQHMIATWMARRLGDLSLQTFERHEADLKRIIDDNLEKALRNNRELKRLKLIPGAGLLIHEVLHASVKDITFETIRGSVHDLSLPENNAGIINDAGNLLLHTLIDVEPGEEQTLDDLVSEISIEAIEVLKQEVAVRQWKQPLSEE